MNGRTNAKNGAGAIRDGCAVLEVRAPAYSQITATRSDGLTKRQRKGYVDLSDSDFWFYYIIIQKFELSNLEWIVLATDGTDSASTTVIITTEGQYKSVKLDYALYLIQSGDLILTPSYDHAVLTSTGDYVQLTATGNYYCAAIFGPVDFTGKSNLTIDIGPGSKTYTADTVLMCPSIGTATSAPTLNQNNGNISPYSEYMKLPTAAQAVGSVISTGQHTLPVTANGNQYVWVEWSAQKDYNHSIYISNFFLS